jgi:hypothetical protein
LAGLGHVVVSVAAQHFAFFKSWPDAKAKAIKITLDRHAGRGLAHEEHSF